MESIWAQSYERRLNRAIATGEVEIIPNGKERRMNPRFKIPGRQIQITDSIQREVINMSISGVSFYSDRNHLIGEVVPLCLDGAFSVQTKVVGCQMVPTDPTFLEFKYRVRCKFVKPDHGLTFLMLALEDSGNERSSSILEQTGT